MTLALLTDLYQLTMVQGYWQQGLATDGTEAAFHLFFRKAPFRGHYAVAGGLEPALEYLTALAFDGDDLTYLAGLPDAKGEPLFQPRFLDWLSGLRFQGDVDAVREGEIVFPHEPLLRVVGNLAQCQLVETALLNLVNFQTLIATKAARIAAAADGQQVIEFGLRRAQGVDGALSASRAAYLGGCSATSNVLAGRTYGIPVRGTHAHAWVMVFGDEREAFQAYADAMPGNVTLLVDTYDTLDGVRNAIAVGRSLRARGHELLGIRLDSGDLHALSVAARRLLDDAGFTDTAIVASNDLDEAGIQALRRGGAAVSVWGVGTRLVTANDQPALGGVYKLAAIRRPGGVWTPRIKLSEQVEKTSNPGMQCVRRFETDGGPVRDVIYDEALGCTSGPASAGAKSRELLVPMLRGGVRVAPAEPLSISRARALSEARRFGVTREALEGAHYPVELDPALQAQKVALVAAARGT
jgi:nicotinate phosphoribosyltransferase